MSEPAPDQAPEDDAPEDEVAYVVLATVTVTKYLSADPADENPIEVVRDTGVTETLGMLRHAELAIADEVRAGSRCCCGR